MCLGRRKFATEPSRIKPITVNLTKLITVYRIKSIAVNRTRAVDVNHIFSLANLNIGRRTEMNRSKTGI